MTPVISFKNVLFPTPLGPTMATVIYKHFMVIK